MARTGVPKADAHGIEQIAERQLGVCAGIGCDNPIITAEKVRMGDEEVVQTFIEGGKLQHILPRRLGGADNISNLEIMCDDCHGMTARTISIPEHLIKQSKRWIADQEDVRSFTHLVRLSVADFIKTDESHVERKIHESALADIEKLKQKLELSLALKKEAEDATVKLTRLYGYEVKEDLSFVERKSKQRRHQPLGDGRV